MRPIELNSPPSGYGSMSHGSAHRNQNLENSPSIMSRVFESIAVYGNGFVEWQFPNLWIELLRQSGLMLEAGRWNIYRPEIVSSKQSLGHAQRRLLSGKITCCRINLLRRKCSIKKIGHFKRRINSTPISASTDAGPLVWNYRLYGLCGSHRTSMHLALELYRIWDTSHLSW